MTTETHDFAYCYIVIEKDTSFTPMCGLVRAANRHEALGKVYEVATKFHSQKQIRFVKIGLPYPQCLITEPKNCRIVKENP